VLIDAFLECKRSESNGHFGSPCAVGSGSAVDFSSEYWKFLQAHLLLNTDLIRKAIGRSLGTFRPSNVRKSRNIE